MLFTFLYRVDPPSYFGLPESDKLVVKAVAGREVYGPTIHSGSGCIAGHGSLPEYRRDSEAINLEAVFGGNRIRIRDNFIELQIEAKHADAALETAIPLIERLLRQLMAEQGNLFRYELIFAEDEAGRLLPSPDRMVEMMRVTMYNLDQLTANLKRAIARAAIADVRLDKALLYYEHAMLLFNLRGHVAYPSPHHSLIISSAYLNLWKALTAILGEPGTDRDYQRRFRDFGFPEDFWMSEVAPLKRLRDRSDVAHYTLDVETVVEIEAVFGRADQICRRVIIQYSDHLVSALREDAANADCSPT